MINIRSFKDFDIHMSIFKSDENNREINIYKYDNCIPCGHNLYYPNVLLNTDNNGLILPLIERTMSLGSGTIYEKSNMSFDYKSKKINNIYDNPVFFFVYNTDNYYHYIYDTLPYLISFLKLKFQIPEVKLLMQLPNEQKNSFYPFVIEFLEILNIYQNDIVLIDDNTIYNTIYISTSYTHDIDSNLPPRKEIYSFYQDIVNIVKEKYSLDYNSPSKIYISRRTWLHNDFSNIGTNYTTRRRLVNEDELVERLKCDGFTEVFTEKLTTTERILYFSNATHVVGAIGGGISNVLFSPKTTKLEAIISPTFLEVNKRFCYSLECVDVFYNHGTIHIEDGLFKVYMRIKSKDNKIVGEIEKIYDDKLLVSYTDGSNTGWNSQNTFKKIELYKNDVIKLDNGLNSAWKLMFL